MAVGWGVDVGAAALHCVALDERYRLVDCAVLDARDVESAVGRLVGVGADVVAIDAPAGLSTRPHRDDTAISPKFQGARCAEVALGLQHRHWVPWVSPSNSAPGWMQVGFALYAAVRERVTDDVIEVYPHACFRELAGAARLPKKTTAAGAGRRAELLRAVGLEVTNLQMWSHDALDAAVAAVTAVQKYVGHAVEVSCAAADGRDHDGSAIWLPARP